jgi:hypothetical protein
MTPHLMIGAAATALALLIGVWLHGQSTGAAGADLAWRTAAQAEQTRQREIRRQLALTYQRRITELTAAAQAARSQARRLLHEARRDPDANRPALGADSLRRIGSVN